MNRRSFLKQSSMAMAGIIIVPSYAISGLGHINPSDKLHVAGR